MRSWPILRLMPRKAQCSCGSCGANVPSLPVGKAHVAIKASGKWETGFDVQSTAALAGADASCRGRYLPNTASTDPIMFGSATVKADNLLPALAAFGLAASNAGAVAPADLTADFVVRSDRASFPHIKGLSAGPRSQATSLGDRGPRPMMPPRSIRTSRSRNRLRATLRRRLLRKSPAKSRSTMPSQELFSRCRLASRRPKWARDGPMRSSRRLSSKRRLRISV